MMLYNLRATGFAVALLVASGSGANANSLRVDSTPDQVITVGADFNEDVLSGDAAVTIIDHNNDVASWKVNVEDEFRDPDFLPTYNAVITESSSSVVTIAVAAAVDASGQSVDLQVSFSGNEIHASVADYDSFISFPVEVIIGADRSTKANASSNTERANLDNATPYSSRFLRKRPSKVGIPRRYVYDLNKDPVALHDYCTLSPNKWFSADFRGPCARHDLCYQDNGTKGARDRKCQTPFRNRLKQNCSYAYYRNATRRGICRGVANGYFEVVKRRNNDLIPTF